MRKGRDREKMGGGGKEKTDDYSGNYVIASSRPPKRRPLEHRTLVPKSFFVHFQIRSQKVEEKFMKICAQTRTQELISCACAFFSRMGMFTSHARMFFGSSLPSYELIYQIS